MAMNRIVLLPGMDGTGNLLLDFSHALPSFGVSCAGLDSGAHSDAGRAARLSYPILTHRRERA